MTSSYFPTFVDLLVGVLATWRLASIVTRSNGPGQIFLRLRLLADPQGVERGGSLGELMNCLFCFSVYAAAIVFFLPQPIVYILALSGGAMLLDAPMPKERAG